MSNKNTPSKKRDTQVSNSASIKPVEPELVTQVDNETDKTSVADNSSRQNLLKTSLPKKSSFEGVNLFIAVFSLITSVTGIYLSYQVSVQTKEISQQQTVIADQALRSSVQTNVYNFGHSISLLFSQHPHLREYFEPYIGEAPKSDADKKARQEYLTEKYATKASATDKSLLYTACEIIVDHYEFMVINRCALEQDDWASWWEFICDEYDNSPLIRQYLRENSDWYLTYKYIAASSDARAKFKVLKCRNSKPIEDKQ
jgi:hypothetical protein